MEKCSRAAQASGDNIIWHVHLAFSIAKATDTYPEYVILIAFPCSCGYLSVPSCYIYMYIAYLVCF